MKKWHECYKWEKVVANFKDGYKSTSNIKLLRNKKIDTHSCRFQQASNEVEYISVEENMLYQNS